MHKQRQVTNTKISVIYLCTRNGKDNHFLRCTIPLCFVDGGELLPTGLTTVYLTSQCYALRNPGVKNTMEDPNTPNFYTWRMREDTRYSKQRLGKF